MRRRSSAGSMSSPPRTTMPSRAGSVARIRWTRRFPMHPSYEARSGVPDRAFPWVSPAQGERMTAAWARLIAGSDAMSRARLLHLHHLTPIHDAVVAAVPDVPVVTHLHGTELRMLDAISRGDAVLADGPHADWWEGRMRAAAQRAAATIAISPFEQERAVRLLGLDPDTVHCLPNGVDIDRFTPYRPSDAVRRALWLRWLVHDAQGWDETTVEPGQRALRRARGARRVLRPGERRAAARADVRRSLPRLQARPAPDPRLRPRAGPHGGSRAARHLGRHAGGVGGRASTYRRHTRGRRRGLLHRLARPRRPAPRPQLRRYVRRTVDRRAVRARVPRGDGLRAPGDRHDEWRAAELRERRPPASQTAGSCRPTTRPR